MERSAIVDEDGRVMVWGTEWWWRVSVRVSSSSLSSWDGGAGELEPSSTE